MNIVLIKPNTHLTTKEANASFWTAKEQTSFDLLFEKHYLFVKTYFKAKTTLNNKYEVSSIKMMNYE